MSTTPSVVIVSCARTPIAKFRGSLSSLSAPQLGSTVIRAALSRLVPPDNNDTITPGEAYMGNVVSAGIGQAPCRQAVMGANLPPSTVCTTINKVCASGMKSVMLASNSIRLGYSRPVLAGGMESMSNVPFYLPALRNGKPLGHDTLLDGVIHDGLWDVYNNQHMGMCAEKCAKDYDIGRQEQDEYAVQSYQRAQHAIKEGIFQKHDEIVPVEIPSKKKGGDSTIVDTDEEPHSVNFDKLSSLQPAFQRDGTGTVTAANASSLNDGAAVMVLMNEADARDCGLEPLAKTRGYGDAERDPVDFTTAPSFAVPVALDNAGMTLDDVEYHEINEAFAVVALANMKLLNLDPSRVNVFGGAVALGHPIGMSGTRIIGTLLSVLREKDATIGCASICNGGGGASAIVIERMS